MPRAPVPSLEKILRLMAVASVAMLPLSCASYVYQAKTTTATAPYAQRLVGKTVGIVPLEVSFGAPRLTIDLRDSTLTVNGQELKLQTRYIAHDENLDIGKFGVLDVNIFKKAGVPVQKVSETVTQALVDGLSGKRDYQVPFMRGLGEDNMGILSNRPVDQDRKVYPTKTYFLEAPGPAPYFSKVQILPPGNSTQDVDFILSGDISISNEVVEVTEDPDPTNLNKPKAGSYFISIMSSIRFELTDAKTGEVVASQESDASYPLRNLTMLNVPIDAPKGDAAAYAKYFRSVDLSEYAIKNALDLIESQLPRLSPYCATTFHAIKVEKTE